MSSAFQVWGTVTFSQSAFHLAATCMASAANGPFLNSHPSLNDVTSRASAFGAKPSKHISHTTDNNIVFFIICVFMVFYFNLISTFC